MECLASNQNYLEFTVYRNDTEEMIYHTGLLEPNQYILTDYLQTKNEMPKGVYPCTIEISSYDMDTGEFIGMAQADLTITMKK